MPLPASSQKGKQRVRSMINRTHEATCCLLEPSKDAPLLLQSTDRSPSSPSALSTLLADSQCYQRSTHRALGVCLCVDPSATTDLLWCVLWPGERAGEVWGVMVCRYLNRVNDIGALTATHTETCRVQGCSMPCVFMGLALLVALARDCGHCDCALWHCCLLAANQPGVLLCYAVLCCAVAFHTHQLPCGAPAQGLTTPASHTAQLAQHSPQPAG
jgi:hypothetical protein